MTLFTYQGAPVRLHSSFFLIAAIYAFLGFQQAGIPGALIASVFVTMLFGIVLLHEMGHVAVAKRFGINTSSITLHILGGLAAIEKEPENPIEEIYIALAGPAVNIALLILSIPFVLLSVPGSFEFAVINFVMGIFNLVPAYPMDGGRVFHALLSMRYGPEKSKKISLRTTIAFAIAFVVAGLYMSWIGLILVGGFLFIIARAMQKNTT